MKLLSVYQCLCDPTRLRLLHLLSIRALCVCHFQEILGEPQVKISKHLAYLKARGMAKSRRHQNWMIYSLPARRNCDLENNLRCLRECAATEPVLKKDALRLARLKTGCDPLEVPIKTKRLTSRSQLT